MTNNYLTTIQLTAQGLPQKTIAAQLNISPHTVQDRIDRMKKKYEAASVAHLIYILCKNGTL